MADKTEFLQAIGDAILDADSLELFINGSDSETVLTRLSAEYPTLQKAIKQMFENGGLPATPFKTKALMTASSLVDGDYAQVTDDAVDDNNGLYVKTAGAWVKSKYDPLTQAKADATTKANTAKSEAITESVAQSTNNTKTIVAEATKYMVQTDSAALHQWADENDLVVGSINSNAEFEAQDFKTEKGSLSTVVEVVDQIDIPDYAHVFNDSSGNILMGIKQDGSIVGATSGGSGLAEMRAGILNSAEMNEVGLALDSKYLDDVPLNYDVLVAEHGSDDTLHQRMPTAIKLSENLLYVAFAQFSSEGYDGKDGRLVGRFVEYDLDAKTSTVGATQVIDGEKIGSLSRHPVFIELRDKIVLLFNDNNNLVQMESLDRCQTWTNRRVLTLEGHPVFLGLDTAVQIQHGKFAGRVCVATYSSNSVAIVYSDDDCVTWEKGAVLKGDVAFPSTPALTEPSITLDASQNIVMVIRNETAGTSSRYVLFAKSVDGGNTLQPIGMDPVLPSSQCQMGFKQFAPDLVNVPKIILSHPTLQSFSRQQFRVRLSYDNCQSFVTSYAPFADDYRVAYSSVCVLDNKTFALLYEDGATNQTQSIHIKFLNLSEII